MFSFFKKKDAGIKTSDFVWMNEEVKWKALIQLAKEQPNTVLIYWFDETQEKIATHLEAAGLASNSIFSAQQVRTHDVQNKPVIFVEHHPMMQKEADVFQRLELSNVIIHTALDEPILKRFGGERVIDMMKKLGMKEDESIQHGLISSSIKNAQEKIAGKVLFEHSARSQEDWFRQNMRDDKVDF